MLDLSYKAKVRIYFPEKLLSEKSITLTTKQVHYLINVMRKKKDDTILIFNNIDGEFLAKISEIYKKYIIFSHVFSFFGKMLTAKKLTRFFPAPLIFLQHQNTL